MNIRNFFALKGIQTCDLDVKYVLYRHMIIYQSAKVAECSKALVNCHRQHGSESHIVIGQTFERAIQ